MPIPKSFIHGSGCLDFQATQKEIVKAVRTHLDRELEIAQKTAEKPLGFWNKLPFPGNKEKQAQQRAAVARVQQLTKALKTDHGKMPDLSQLSEEERISNKSVTVKGEPVTLAMAVGLNQFLQAKEQERNLHVSTNTAALAEQMQLQDHQERTAALQQPPQVKRPFNVANDEAYAAQQKGAQSSAVVEALNGDGTITKEGADLAAELYRAAAAIQRN